MGAYELIKSEENVIEYPVRVVVSIDDGCVEQSEKLISTTRFNNGEIPNRIASSAAAAPAGLSGVASKRRLVSLDVFRGIAVALMILVDDAGGIFPSINHSPWNGVTLADFVMPFFLFIVGVSLGLTYKKVSYKGDATKKAALRALKLFMLGILLQGGYFHGVNNLTFGVDLWTIRLMGTLQRISVAYLIAAICEIWLKNEDAVDSRFFLLRKYQFHWLLAMVLTAIYLILLYGLKVPSWTYQISSESNSIPPKTFAVECGIRGDTGPACNAVGMIDRNILGIQHLYKRPIYARTKECSINSPVYGPLPPNAPAWCQAPFEPEGLLSSVMAIVTCLIGLHYGHVIVHFKDHKDRILQWTIPSSSLLLLGIFLDLVGMHVNKVLYTLSYTFLTSGAAGIFFVGTYVLVDLYGYRRPTIAMEWMGKHALILYILAACNIVPILIQGFYWKKPENNILRLFGVGS